MSAFQIGRPRFVTTDEAVAFHAIGIEEYGGAHGLRDAGALDSALAQPRQAFAGEFAHPYPFGMAAAYAFHIAKNHPFVDGNKRAALMCCGAFLRMNGWSLTSFGEDAADQVVALVTGETDKAAFASWLSQNSRPRPSVELRDFFAVVRLADTFKMTGSISNQIELDATHAEAKTAIPLLRDIEQLKSTLKREGALERAARYDYLEVALTAIYRIAEDMGYEW